MILCHPAKAISQNYDLISVHCYLYFLIPFFSKSRFLYMHHTRTITTITTTTTTTTTTHTKKDSYYTIILCTKASFIHLSIIYTSIHLHIYTSTHLYIYTSIHLYISKQFQCAISSTHSPKDIGDISVCTKNYNGFIVFLNSISHY